VEFYWADPPVVDVEPVKANEDDDKETKVPFGDVDNSNGRHRGLRLESEERFTTGHFPLSSDFMSQRLRSRASVVRLDRGNQRH
jgi:hypothetical protein